MRVLPLTFVTFLSVILISTFVSPQIQIAPQTINNLNITNDSQESDPSTGLRHLQHVSNRQHPQPMGVKIKKKEAEVFVPPSPPVFSDLDKIAPSQLHLDPVFIEACKAQSGYYKDATTRPDLKNTIMLVGINNGYRDFFHNFKCFCDRLGIKFLPISLDEGIYKYLISNQNQLGLPTVLLGDIPGRDSVEADPSKFGGRNFNLIGCRKMEAVAAALQLGYDVIFSDVDIALLRDPIEDLFVPGVHYTHSTNNGCERKWGFNDTMEGNTGFYAVRSNAMTIRTWDYTYRSCSIAPLYDDQTMFWLILRYNQHPYPIGLTKCPSNAGSGRTYGQGAGSGAYSTVYHEQMIQQQRTIQSMLISKNVTHYSRDKLIITCPLDNCLYSASQLKSYNDRQKLLQVIKTRYTTAVMIHANWLSGKQAKKSALMQVGLWIVSNHNNNNNNNNNNNKQKLPEGDALRQSQLRRNNNNGSNWVCNKQLSSPFL